MTYDPLGPAERARQLDQLDEQLAQQRFDQQAVPVPTGDRFADLCALDDAIRLLDERVGQADVELRAARAEAGKLPDLEQHRVIAKQERRFGELAAMRSRAIARRDRLERGPDGPLW